ncbi:D-alanyl-D-alanine carboxypeptidase [Rhodohalobacter barkolensis]|uniref:D-alanyl-D-alanine carboxypeptidase n=2 Tax=Rhodohalobacter barkolensis TaxID=2053187 RepID=A0A2N0VH85_9BACT|nr:D-alanyl-D-alanine carboxypeptidase [Rhodohalobacter barkolensis]
MLLKSIVRLLILSVISLIFLSCQTSEIVTSDESDSDDMPKLHQIFEESEVFSQSMTGFALYDPETETMLYERESDQFYVPASNTKILTLYAAMNELPDTLPSLRYAVRNDTLYFQGTGDPGFLNPNFEFTEVYDFLKSRDEVMVFTDQNYSDEHFGAGWAWDWYPAAYAPEKSPFPIYGNMMRLQTEQVALVQLNEETPVKPKFFERYIERDEWNGEEIQLVKRSQRSNDILYTPKADTARQERNVPFVYDNDLFVEMLSDTLGREVQYAESVDLDFTDTLYATPADSLYKRFMVVSDNFIAEQLMLMISEQQFGEMNTTRGIRFALDEYFDDLPQRPNWRDGSGLTKYNLVTPHSLVMLLEKLVNDFGEEKVLSYFPIGGVRGTISGLYRAPEGEEPYVYAKTGTLSNTTALSGYIFTDSGRRLNFSILNNNYVIGNNQMRLEMQKIMEFIKENY